MLRADLDVRRADRGFEQPPEAFHGVDVERLARTVVVVGVFLLAMLHRAMREAVASE